MSKDHDFAFAHVKESNPLSFFANCIGSAIHHVFAFIFGLEKPVKHVHGMNCSSHGVHQTISSWRVRVSMFCMHILLLLRGPFALFGTIVEFCLNVISANNGLPRTLLKLLFQPRDIVIPSPEHYRSFIGHLDSRWDIPLIAAQRLESADWNEDEVDSEVEAAATTSALTDQGLHDTFPSVWCAQVCVMAAKLSYENKHFIRRVVEKRWKMCFVEFFSCWNEYLGVNGTQAYLFMDKREDANAVVVAFRGTSPFENYDWCTDMDFSWYCFPHVGKVHVGFLEALGLGSRKHMESFGLMKNITELKARRETPSSASASGLPDAVKKDSTKLLAYDAITSRVRDLLRANPRAKFYVTGHSLGGALTATFAGMLLLEDDHVILPRLQGVVTFGQPRVGDEKFKRFVESHLCKPDDRKYLRVVYTFDLPARIPFDDPIFDFKHIGLCHYHAGRFEGQILEEAPHKNYLTLLLLPSTYIAAAWDIIETLILKYYARYGETWCGIIFGAVSFLVPGVPAHSPSNYVNGILMGPSNLYQHNAWDNGGKEEGGFFYRLSKLFHQIRELRARKKRVQALRRKRMLHYAKEALKVK